MGNCLVRWWWIGGGLEETTMSAASAFTTPDETSNFHIALEECNLSSLDKVALGDCSIAGSSSLEPKFEYFSTRVEEMMQHKSQFSSAVEHEIEFSRVHWSEVSDLSDVSEDNNYEEVNRENEELFVELMNDPQWLHEVGGFFQHWPPLWKLGRKIAEGGQAAIFEAIDPNGIVDTNMLLKVFKGGSRLSDLKTQWPHGILRFEVPLCVVFWGTMLEDRRFAFWMRRCWGDLRKLIDQAMQEKNNQGLPFPYELNGHILYAKDIMWDIALHMDILHKKGIIHRDLKAANILLCANNVRLKMVVADFECSIGVIGTGFWRAPEILLALKNRSAIDFSEKMDVYSYGMTCFEIVTGRLPFEGELEACRASNDLIIEGHRPKLPSDLDVILKNVIEKCWSPNPNERPSFLEIYEELVLAS